MNYLFPDSAKVNKKINNIDNRPVIQRVNKTSRKELSIKIESKTVDPQYNGWNALYNGINTNKKIDYLIINTVDSNLSIYCYDKNHVTICNDDNGQSTTVESTYIKQNCLILTLKQARNYSIFIPRKKYKKLAINANKSIVLITDKNSNIWLNINELSVNINDGFLSCAANSSSFEFNGNGKIFYIGRIDNCSIYGNKLNISLHINKIKKSSNNKYHIITNKGDVRIDLIGMRIKPRVNHLFQKVRIVKGCYFFDTNLINLDIKTLKGGIIIK